MRAEALVLLRAGLESALDTESAPVEEPKGRAAKRTAAYMAEVAAASNYKMRISADAPGVAERVAVNALGPDGEIIAELLNSEGSAPIHTSGPTDGTRSLTLQGGHHGSSHQPDRKSKRLNSSH